MLDWGNAARYRARVKTMKLHTKKKINYKFMTRNKTRWNCSLRKIHYNLSKYPSWSALLSLQMLHSFDIRLHLWWLSSLQRGSVLKICSLHLIDARKKIMRHHKLQIKLLRITDINDFKFTLSAVTSIAFKPSEDIMSTATRARFYFDPSSTAIDGRVQRSVYTKPTLHESQNITRK